MPIYQAALCFLTMIRVSQFRFKIHHTNLASAEGTRGLTHHSIAHLSQADFIAVKDSFDVPVAAAPAKGPILQVDQPEDGQGCNEKSKDGQRQHCSKNVTGRGI